MVVTIRCKLLLCFVCSMGFLGKGRRKEREKGNRGFVFILFQLYRRLNWDHAAALVEGWIPRKYANEAPLVRGLAADGTISVSRDGWTILNKYTGFITYIGIVSTVSPMIEKMLLLRNY